MYSARLAAICWGLIYPINLATFKKYFKAVGDDFTCRVNQFCCLGGVVSDCAFGRVFDVVKYLSLTFCVKTGV